MGMTTSGGPNAPMSEINITPFVEVMLVLLIIFMVTAPMLSKGVEIDLPKAKAQPMEVDESKLLMVIDAKRRVFLGETESPHARLEEALVNNVRLQREGGFVVQVMAIIKKAGVPKLGMVTDPIDEEWPPPPPTPQAETASLKQVKNLLKRCLGM